MGKGGGRKVYDAILSVDYGFCHGPIDSWNAVWIKDKQIFCGAVSAREDIDINQPSVFGGDEGEGGVVGVIEAYMGSDDQLASEALATRLGRTPTTTPGHRSIAKLFFRGTSAVAGGFRWVTNNLYFPATKASVTRIPAQLGASFKTIPATVGLNPDGSFLSATPNPVSLPSTRPTLELDMDGYDETPEGAERDVTVFNGMSGRIQPSVRDWDSVPLDQRINLLDLATEQDITAGVVSAFGEAHGRVLRGGTISPASAIAQLAFFDSDGSILPFREMGETGKSDNDSDGEWDLILPELVAPVGAVEVRFQISVQPFLLLFTNVVLDNAFRAVRVRKTVWNYCTASSEGLRELPDANPAHFIYEALTDTVYGDGQPVSLIDVPSFEAAAETFFDERMGVSFAWFAQDDVGKLISEVLDHVQAVLVQSPSTGKWKLKALRDDYDVGTLPELGPSNCRLSGGIKRMVWGELANSITGTYTDPVEEKAATVTSLDGGAIAIQGTERNDTRDYYMFRNPYITKWRCDREVRATSYPLAACSVEASRSFWQTEPGDVVKLSWPDDGVTDLIMRVMKVDRGTTLSREIKLDLVEDIFGLDQATYQAPQVGLWEDDRADPMNLNAQAAFTVPYPMLTLAGLDPEEIEAEEPTARVQLMGASGEFRPLDIEAHTLVSQPVGAATIEPVVTFPQRSSRRLGMTLSEAASGTVSVSKVAELLPQAAVGDLILIGLTDRNSELVALESTDGTDWTVIRGVWDTVPQAWPDTARVWAYPLVQEGIDPNLRADGDEIEYRLLPRTYYGRLDYADAYPLTYVGSSRPHLPFRPANVELGGSGFGTYDMTPQDPPEAGVLATWSNRNRQTEDASYRSWGDGSVTPEVGQTTELRITSPVGTPITTITDLTGTSHLIPLSAFEAEEEAWVEFWAKSAAGDFSLQAARRYVILPLNSGYGYGYGYNYGGNTFAGYGRGYGYRYGA